MGLTKCKLGKYIIQSDERNVQNKYDITSVVGISTQKQIIKTKADLKGVNLTSYKLFGPKQFAYVPDTSRRGEKMSLAYNTTKETYLVSAITIVFSVAETKHLLSDYLFMYFNRPEFDRYSRFNSWGSAREAFSWEAMCDIDIDLPALDIQQQYVDIYKAMVANQQSYERGLEDLKLTIEALADDIKKKAPKKPLGSVLDEIDIRNEDLEISNIQGINITKHFMPTVADTNGLDLSKYKIVKKGEFAYSGMQTGRDKTIRIAMYQGEEPIIISPAYTVLAVKKETVIPEYVMIWFSRKESDRRGWFMSDASIRTNLDLDRFYETEFPVPDIQTQKAIADVFTVYMTRKAINEQLKAQIKAICPILIRGSLANGG